MFRGIIIFVFLFVVKYVNGGASNSLSDCNTLAAKFSSTCGGTAFTSIASGTGTSVTCTSGFNATICPGIYSGSTCTFTHKLCVTCSGSSPTRIRVQSNGLPQHCPNTPAPISEQNLDFTVNFNTEVSVNSPVHSPTTVTALNAIVCNVNNQASVSSASNYVSSGSTGSMSVLAGISIDGVAILNVNSANNVDPFFPSPTSYAAESVDACLGHPNPANIYHYHAASGCGLSPPSGAIASCAGTTACASSVSSYSISSFTNYRSLNVIGIAKDGHIIYGPYTSAGVEVTTGFDICNGMFHDSTGNYGYFATRTYPYITGCFGPGNYPSVVPSCTTNPPSAYSKSSYASSANTFIRSNNIIYAIMASMTIYIYIQK